MSLLLIIFPLAVSFLIGYLLLLLLLGRQQKADPLLFSFLAAGLGLGVSSGLTFFNFILFNEYNRFFLIGIHLLLLLGLAAKRLQDCRRHETSFWAFTPPDRNDILIAAGLLLAAVPITIYANLYPYGGWDAWSCWNLKARFLYLGGEDWQNMLDPVIWRSSPHYPLLLPLVNVWTWSFLPIPLELGPLVVSVLFTILTAGLLAASLRLFIPGRVALVAALLFLTLPFYVKLAISQYCDGILGYYLLAALFCFIQAKEKENTAWALLAGLFVGILSFTKPEGMIASLILIGLAFPYFFWRERRRANQRQKLIQPALVGAALAFIPTALFHLLYSPGNQTFINGLISPDHPSDLYRFKFIFAYLYTEITSEKWHWLWGFLAIGIILSRRQGFNRNVFMVPLFLLVYFGIITVYYFINTYFKIEWWMQVTLNRILFSLLPIVIFWSFYALWQEKDASKQ